MGLGGAAAGAVLAVACANLDGLSGGGPDGGSALPEGGPTSEAGTDAGPTISDTKGFSISAGELTFSFDVLDRYAEKAGAHRASLSLSGRNLGLWTPYQGFEPEAMFLGGTRGGNVAWEQTTLPQLRTWIFSINLTL